MRRTTLWAAVAAVAGSAALAGPVRADTLWIGESAGNPIQTSGVKVQSATADGLTFTTDLGTSRTVPMARVQRVNVDGDTAFNAAEEAYGRNNWSVAASNYLTVVQRASTKDWEKARAGQRLVTAARGANNYAAEVAGYAAVVQTTPAAAAARPAKPTDNDPGLDAAQATVNAALTAGRLDNSGRVGLLGVALDIALAKHDAAAVAAALQQMTAAGGGGSPADQAMLKLATATVDLDQKKYQDAANLIEQNKPLFTDPDQQVDALYVLAQARDGLDGDKADPTALRDVAIAYMRAAAFGNDRVEQGRPHAADALVRVAQIEEKLKDPAEALGVYTRVSTDPAYAAATAARTTAKAAVDRLKKAGVTTTPKQ